MSNDLIALKQNLPAFLAVADAAAANADLTGHAGAGFPSMSIKGKVFTLVRGGERQILMSPADPDAPASSIEVVILKANPKNSKTYYAEAYVDGSDATPTCYSNDGIKPAADAAAPQCKTCAACPQNVWGSRTGENGSKGKACQDNARVAIASPDAINDPMLLRVPPASLKPLAEYGKALAKLNPPIPYNAVITKLGFDHTQATPKLTFKAVSYVTAEQYAQVQEQLEGDVVSEIIGLSSSGSDEAFETPAGTPPAAAVESAPAPAPAKPAAKAAPKPAAKAAPKAAPAPMPEPEVEATSPEVTAEAAAAGDALMDDIDAMLGSLDD